MKKCEFPNPYKGSSCINCGWTLHKDYPTMPIIACYKTKERAVSKMISQYLQERAKWTKAGKPLRTQEEMDKLFTICNSCPQYKKYSDHDGQCSVCGCNIKKEGTFLNKIAWGTTRCPLPEPKWVESTEELAKEIEITPEDLSQAQAEHAEEVPVTELKKGGGCGCGK